MVFSDLFFLFVFLPAVALSYLLASWTDRLFSSSLRPSFWARNLVLILFSLVFYAWGEPVYVLLMLLCVLITYLAGRLIGAAKNHSKAALVVGLVCNIGILCVFKYTGMIVETLQQMRIAVPDVHIALPIGISFYIFQSISYLVDVYRKDSPVQKNFFNLLLYISLFPQLIAGPIVRYGKVAEELHNRRSSAQDIAEGSFRFLVGLGKKVILANQFSELSGQLMGDFTGSASAASAWLGVLAYALQIYFDFSGYSDMAIGIGRCFGFHFNENFNHPYISDSITEFWRRWHMSLTTFFRDYVYIPLGGNRRHQMFNILLVWFLTGLWHGADWNFALWGLFFALVIIFEKHAILPLQKYIWRPFRHLYAIFIMLVSFVLFYFDDLTRVGDYYKSMFGFGTGSYDFVAQTALFNHFWLWIAGLLCALPLMEWGGWLLDKMCNREGKVSAVITLSLRLLFSVAVLILCVALLVGATNNAYIYSRF